MRLAVLLTLAGLLKTAALVVVVLAAMVYGLKSVFTSTINTRRRYHLNVAQNLYYQSLDNNAGAMLRLLEEGEQQEACEAVLSYFAAAVLLQNESSLEIAPVSLSPVDAVCEQIIFEATGVHVDFDVHGAIEDLVHLGLIHATAISGELLLCLRRIAYSMKLGISGSTSNLRGSGSPLSPCTHGERGRGVRGAPGWEHAIA